MQHLNSTRRFKWPTGWRLSAYIAVGVLLFTSVAILVAWNFYGFRNAAKWSLWSRSYKSEVLAEPFSSNGDFKHIEWDGWGWAGQDTTVYLVFDPANELSTAAKAASTRQV